jgi:hypothetical protein
MLHISIIFCIFAIVMEVTNNLIINMLNTHNAMNKTVKIILEIIAAICAGLLGGAGAQTLM